MRKLPILVAAAVCTFGGFVYAREASREDQAGRYTMQAVDGGFLRLDTETGGVSLCSKRDGKFACELVQDDRVLQSEIDRLLSENRDLKRDVKRLEELLATAEEKRAEGDKLGEKGPKFELPTEEDVDKALNYIERMVKKFRNKMKELEEDTDGRKGTPL